MAVDGSRIGLTDPSSDHSPQYAMSARLPTPGARIRLFWGKTRASRSGGPSGIASSPERICGSRPVSAKVQR